MASVRALHWQHTTVVKLYGQCARVALATHDSGEIEWPARALRWQHATVVNLSGEIEIVCCSSWCCCSAVVHGAPLRRSFAGAVVGADAGGLLLAEIPFADSVEIWAHGVGGVDH